MSAGDPGGAGDPGIAVYGGRGGTRANLEDLARATRALRAAAHELDAAATSCSSAGWRLTGPGSPGGSLARDDACLMTGIHDGLGTLTEGELEVARARARALAALAEVRRSPTGPAVAAAHLTGLASALLSTTRIYAEADGAARLLVSRLSRAVGSAAGEHPLGLLVAGAIVGRLAIAVAPAALLGASVVLRRTPGDLVAATRARAAQLANDALTEDAARIEIILAGVGSGLVSLPLGVQPVAAEPVPAAARLASGALDLDPHWRRRALTVIPAVESQHPPAPRDLGDLARRLSALYPDAGGRPGTIGVERLDHPDGTRSWVVEIPGTQELGLGFGENPLDMGTNVRLMAARPNDGTELVTEALRQAGVGANEPILLLGHSQGGMVAMSLAATAAFTSRYRVAAVATLGAPVGTVSVPRSIQVLNVEHVQDVIPALDGVPSPDEPNRTTVRRDLRISPDPRDRFAGRTAGAAHGAGTYARSAEVIGGVDGSSLDAWRDAASQVLGDGRATVTAREFTGVRGR